MVLELHPVYLYEHVFVIVEYIYFDFELFLEVLRDFYYDRNHQLFQWIL